MKKIFYEGKWYTLIKELLFNDEGNYQALAERNGQKYYVIIDGNIDPQASDDKFRQGVLDVYPC